MWSVFNKNTGECVQRGFWGIFGAMDWIGEQDNWYELEADDRCPFSSKSLGERFCARLRS